jgi:outer membrane receptor for ferrienterochelin and colicins
LSPTRELTLAATADYSRRRRQAIDLSPAGGAVFDRDNLTETSSVLLKPEWKLRGGTRLELRASLSLFRDQFLLDQRGANDLDELQDTRERLAQLGAQVDILLGASHLLSVGSEAWHETLSTARLVSGRGERSRAALYVQDEWTLLEAPLLVLLPGARIDVDSQFGVYATPRAALRFDPIDELTLRASYGWGFKAPDFRELYLLFENPSAGYLVEGNTELEPETSESVNLGAELRPHPAVWLSVQGFWSELRDRIGTELVPANDVGPRRFRYRNIDSASSVGVEANVRLSPLSGLRLDMGYAWTQTRDDAGGQPFSGQPLHRATASVRYDVPDIGFEALGRGAFVGKRPFYQDTNGDDVAERQDASGYASVDLRLAQQVGYGVSTFLLAENLLNAGDADFLPMQPRTFSGGMRLDY